MVVSLAYRLIIARQAALGHTPDRRQVRRDTEPNRPQLMLVDITMLVMSDGRERTLPEITALFAEAGIELEHGRRSEC